MNKGGSFGKTPYNSPISDLLFKQKKNTDVRDRTPEFLIMNCHWDHRQGSQHLLFSKVEENKTLFPVNKCHDYQMQ